MLVCISQSTMCTQCKDMLNAFLPSCTSNKVCGHTLKCDQSKVESLQAMYLPYPVGTVKVLPMSCGHAYDDQRAAATVRAVAAACIATMPYAIIPVYTCRRSSVTCKNMHCSLQNLMSS